MHLSRGWLTAAAVVLVVVVSACSYLPPQGHGRGSRVAPASGALLGTYTEPSHPDRAGQQTAVRAVEASMNRKLNLVHWFYPWSSPFPTWREPWAQSGGRVNMVSWAPPSSVNDVNSGAYDHLIDQRAQGMKAFSKPILLRWFAEMDSSTRRRQAISPAAFIAAWRHIYNRFNAVGATNVEFVWCPDAWAFDTGTGAQWYPGDDYVQWTCADGYNWAPKKPGAAWWSFQRTFQSFYAWASKRSKPIIVGEVGAVEDPKHSGRKAQWIRDIATTVRNWPRIKALVWFDTTANTRSEPGTIYDWRVNSSPSAEAAWNEIGWWKIFHPYG